MSSVYKKIIGQIDALNTLGVKTKGLFLNAVVTENKSLNQFIDFIHVPKPTKNLFYQIRQQNAYSKVVVDLIKNHPCQQIYLRYSFANKHIYKAIRSSSKNIIVERNSIALSEIASLCNEFKLKPNLSVVLKKIQECYYPAAMECFYGKKINKNTNTLVGVTQEIAELYRSKNSICITNGIAVSNYLPRKNSAPLGDEKLILLILDGTSTPSPWQGVDRLIKSIIYHQLELKIELRIASKFDNFGNNNFVTHLGYLSGSELEKEINNAHIGTGNLCLFRKNLNEASVLKNREYLTRGLPVLYTAIDTDIENTAFKTYCFKVPNDDSLLPLPSIFAWAKQLYKTKPNHPIEMHQLAMEHLDFKVKAKQLLPYLKK